MLGPLLPPSTLLPGGSAPQPIRSGSSLALPRGRRKAAQQAHAAAFGPSWAEDWRSSNSNSSGSSFGGNNENNTQRAQRTPRTPYFTFSGQEGTSSALDQPAEAELQWEPPSRQDHSQLTLSITGCDSTSSLLELLLHNQPRLNGIHLSAAFNRTIKLYRQEAQRPSWRTARMITGALLPLLTSELQSLMPNLAHQPRVVASILHSLGCLDVRDRDLLGGLAALAQGCMPELSTQGLANILWAFARCEYQPSAGWMSAYVCACRARIATFRPQELAMMIWALSKLKYKLSPDMQQDFLARARALFPVTSPQALCMVLYALSMTGHHPGEEWLESFVEAALQPPGLRRFSPQGFSQMLWALSRIGYTPGPKLTEAIEEHLTKHSRMQGYKSIDVATTLYAMARMQLLMSRNLLRLVLDQVERHMFFFQPSQLANVGWALARLQLQLRQLRQWQQSVHQREQQQQQQQYRQQAFYFTDQEQQNLQGQVHYEWEHLQRVDASQSPGKLVSSEQSHDSSSSSSSGMEVHNLFSVGQQQQQQQQLDFPFPTSLLKKYLAASYGNLDCFTSLDLSMTCWALATMRIKPPTSFLSVFLRRVEQVGAEFAPQEVANTLWALARLGAKPPAPVVAEFFSATDCRLSSFKPHELSSMVWALAKMGFTPDKAWTDEFLHATFHKLPDLGCQGLTNVIWALAVMPLRPPPAWLYAFVKAVSAEKAAMRTGDLVLIINSLRTLAEGLQLQKVDACVADLVAEIGQRGARPPPSYAALKASISHSHHSTPASSQPSSASSAPATAATATSARGSRVSASASPSPQMPASDACPPHDSAAASMQQSGSSEQQAWPSEYSHSNPVLLPPQHVDHTCGGLQGDPEPLPPQHGHHGGEGLQGDWDLPKHLDMDGKDQHQQSMPSGRQGSSAAAMRRAEVVRAVADVGITHQQATLIASQHAKRHKGRSGESKAVDSSSLRKPRKTAESAESEGKGDPACMDLQVSDGTSGAHRNFRHMPGIGNDKLMSSSR